MTMATGALGCDKFDPSSPKVRDLRQLMSVAYEEFHQAHVAYEHALSIPSRLLKNVAHGLSLRGTEKDFALRVPTGARLGAGRG